MSDSKRCDLLGESADESSPVEVRARLYIKRLNILKPSAVAYICSDTEIPRCVLESIIFKETIPFSFSVRCCASVPYSEGKSSGVSLFIARVKQIEIGKGGDSSERVPAV